jgi:hypothetical protein
VRAAVGVEQPGTRRPSTVAKGEESRSSTVGFPPILLSERAGEIEKRIDAEICEAVA